MRKLILLAVVGLSSIFTSCVTWVKTEKREEITHGLNGAIIETKRPSVVCVDLNARRASLTTEYFIRPPSGPFPENTKVIEKCSPGTRGKIIRFIQERDASQHTWYHVEFEINDPRLSRAYRIIRMLGLREDVEKHAPWNPERGDFRIVR